MRDGLPQGWTTASLANIGRWCSGGTPSRSRTDYFGQGIPWIKSGDLPDGLIVCTEEQITELGLNNSSAKLMPAGTISIALYGATIGKLGVLTFPAATNQACANVSPHPGLIDPQYLFFYLLSERRTLIEKGQGGAQPNISQEIVKSHPITLAPLNEQRRIVAKLEKLLSRVDAAQARLATIPRILKRFRQSVLAAACSGRLTADWRVDNLDLESAEQLFQRILALRNENRTEKEREHPVLEEGLGTDFSEVPQTWKWVTPNYLCDPLRGISYGVIKLGASVTGGVPCLRTSDVRPLRIDVNNVKRIAPQISESYARTVLKGSEVLVNVRGTLGGVAAVPLFMRGWNVSREVAVIPLLRLVEPRYITFWIASTQSQNWLSGVAKGVAYTGINLEDLRLLPTALPPLAEQQEIVRRVEALFKTADALEARYRTAKAYVDKLTQSILAKAFRGALVPQDPNDEPASVLLDRIRNEKVISAKDRNRGNANQS